MAKELLKLTAAEIFFLRWLRENGGSGVSSGNNWIGAVDRLVKAGYVKEQADSFSLPTKPASELPSAPRARSRSESPGAHRSAAPVCSPGF
jgi:hypothetical protein